MDLRDVRHELERIRSAAVDALYRDVLWAIADGRALEGPEALAEEALKSRTIEFSRWYA